MINESRTHYLTSFDADKEGYQGEGWYFLDKQGHLYGPYALQFRAYDEMKYSDTVSKMYEDNNQQYCESID